MAEKIISTGVLPENYRLVWKLDMRERKSLVIANVAGLLLFIPASILTFVLTRWIRPDAKILLSLNGVSGFVSLLLLILLVVLMLTVHEGFHGIFFWLFTGEVPKFALKQFYAYAAAPDCYLEKWRYFITALAPLIGISLLGLIGIAVAPESWVLPLMLLIIFNASGAIGDLWVAAALLLQKNSVLAHDTGDVVEFYEPA